MILVKDIFLFRDSVVSFRLFLDSFYSMFACM